MEIPSQSVMCSYVIGSFFEYIRFTWQRHRTLRSLFCSDRFKANFFVSWLQQHTLKYLHVSIHQDHKVSSDSEPAYLPLLGVYKPAHMVYSFGLRFRNAGATVRSGLHIEPQPWWYLVYRPDYSRLLQQRSPLQQPGHVLRLCVQFWPEDFGAPSLTTTNFHHQRLNVCEYHLSRSGLAKKPRDDPKVDICQLHGRRWYMHATSYVRSMQLLPRSRNVIQNWAHMYLNLSRFSGSPGEGVLTAKLVRSRGDVEWEGIRTTRKRSTYRWMQVDIDVSMHTC